MLPISISSTKLQVLFSPNEYFNSLLLMIKNAKERLYLSSLYIGSGSIESNMIKEIEMNKRVNRTLDCTLIFDKGRSERKVKGKRVIDTIKHLTHYPNMTISLYQNPLITKSHCSKMPSVIKELIGVYHTKIVISDNDILLTGANFSKSYFTNRTDRYYLFKNCKELSDHLFEYLNAIKDRTFQLMPNGKSYIKEKKQNLFSHQLERYAIKYSHIPIKNLPKDDILLFLSNQLKCEDIKNDENNLKEILRNKNEYSKMVIHSGYCNLSDQLLSLIGDMKTDIYTSSPQTNNFYKGGIVKSYIPYLYRIYENNLINLPNKNITLHEYKRPNWTFHNKGIWLYSTEGIPIITAIGSSNYSKYTIIMYLIFSCSDNRAFNRDLETQFYLLSNNSAFSSQLIRETRAIANHCNIITTETIIKDKTIHLKPYHYILANTLNNFL